nr:MAG TPA: hypothetical protein [Caudoviricetes sp.]
MLNSASLKGGISLTTEKITTRMGSTTVTQTAEGFELKKGI